MNTLKKQKNKKQKQKTKKGSLCYTSESVFPETNTFKKRKKEVTQVKQSLNKRTLLIIFFKQKLKIPIEISVSNESEFNRAFG